MLALTGTFKTSLIVNCCRSVLFLNRNNGPMLLIPAAGIKSLEEQVGLPEKPKKPLTPYFRYMQQIRPKITTENPNSSPQEIVRLIANKWDKVDQQTKKKLEDEYKKDKIAFVDISSKYASKITNEQRDELKVLKQEIATAKQKKVMKKRVQDLGKPKKPPSAFLRFLSHERTITPLVSDQPYKEWHKKTSDKWTKLTEAEKNVFIQETRKALDVYKDEMSKWEEKMVRLGHLDVVRHDSLIDIPEPTKSSAKTIKKEKKTE